MSPFSCFSPTSGGYVETLPRHHQPHPPTPPSFTSSPSPSSTPPAAKRRLSSKPRDGRISKEIIGLPTGFVHLSGSGPSYGSASPKAANVGARGVNKEALEETMANLVLKDSKALPTPASPTRALKDNTNTNASPSPSPTKTSFAPPTSPNAPRRKPAPMVTPSVIRQAGKDVVEATDRNKAVVAALPAVEGSVAEADEKKVEVVKERQEERKELGEVDEFGGGVFRPYATGTGKARWDQSMKEIEEALMM